MIFITPVQTERSDVSLIKEKGFVLHQSSSFLREESKFIVISVYCLPEDDDLVLLHVH